MVGYKDIQIAVSKKDSKMVVGHTKNNFPKIGYLRKIILSFSDDQY
jgi:hypothetical protein